jgi:hypothetical protein
MLDRICRCIEGRRAKGQSLHKALLWFSWYWKDRCYKTSPAQRIRFGYGTLRRIYYTWRAAGGNAEALQLRYWGNSKDRLGIDAIMRMAEQCLVPGVRSLSAAHRQISPTKRTHHAYRHAMPARLRKGVAHLHEARRQAEKMERRVRRLMKELEA